MPDKKIFLRRFYDMHCHFRRGQLLQEVLPETAKYASYAIVMPNTKPRAILTAEDVRQYRDEIEKALGSMPARPYFEPLMTIQIRDDTTPRVIEDAKKAGVIAGKVYPIGVTTNAEEGLREFFNNRISETFQAMQDNGMLLLIHGELDCNRLLVTKREEYFLHMFQRFPEKFPRLRIVLEHISTRAAIAMVKQFGNNVAATITAHHLCLTLNDVIEGGTQPHNMCNPVAKDFDDRDALLKAATSGSPKFFLGSDTAPHPKEKKECAKGSCGVYTAPVLPQILAEIFEKEGKLGRLEDFTSRFGAEFYSLPLDEGKIELVKEQYEVPKQIGSVVPFRAETKLQWTLV